MTIRAVVNVATGRYIEGQIRLWHSLDEFAPDVMRNFWRECWPPGPTHREIPYAFKPLALKATRDGREMPDVALWFDASMIVAKPLDPIWAYIEKHGVLLFEDGWTVGQWCKDEALEPLGYSSRDEAMQVPLTYGPIGIDFRNKRACEFLDEWCRFALDGVTFPGPWKNENGEASADPRCLGHRHDITVAATIAHRMGIPLYKGFLPFMEIGQAKGAIIQLVGI